jgi:hypothetical protein
LEPFAQKIGKAFVELHQIETIVLLQQLENPASNGTRSRSDLEDPGGSTRCSDLSCHRSRQMPATRNDGSRRLKLTTKLAEKFDMVAKHPSDDRNRRAALHLTTLRPRF